MGEVREAVAGERRELAGVLEGLGEREWDAPSLCAGWRVREVVAHMTMAFRVSAGRFFFELARSGGNFTKMADRRAKADAAMMSATELAACVRDNADHPWKPPGGGDLGALSHDVIHGLDITVALGLDRQVPLERLRLVLGGVTPRQLRYFGADLDGLQLRATDLDWILGSGTPVTGPAQYLLLMISGRKVPPGHLTGL